MPEEGFYTQGLDRDKRKVPAITTNPGHALWTRHSRRGQGDRDSAAVVESDMLSGWGLRTLSEGYPSYNPMSYHNGSVWPHDNSIVMAGLRRYGCDHEVNRLSRRFSRRPASSAMRAFRSYIAASSAIDVPERSGRVPGKLQPAGVGSGGDVVVRASDVGAGG